MGRLSSFVMFQRAAFRALFRPSVERRTIDLAAESSHPIYLCRCRDGAPDLHGPHGDHRDDCEWLKRRCPFCLGQGTCGGDGCAPEPVA